MKSNPPIKGHKLLHEGHSVRLIDPYTDDYAGWSYGCECGARPPLVDGRWDPGLNATKRWHREHKARIRDAS